MSQEKCVICECETPYHIDTHIDSRKNYMDGVGQLCADCFRITSNDEHIVIPKIVVENTPNDFELGGIIRKLYWTKKQ